MRDLQKDLEICENATGGPWMAIQDAFENAIYGKLNDGCRGQYICGRVYGRSCVNVDNSTFIAEARLGWPEAIQRAIKAEEEVERLKHALRDMHFAYINKDEDFPHDFEIKAIELAKSILGTPLPRVDKEG